MKSQLGILVFEEEKFTTVSITGTLVHFHPVTDQLKWSYMKITCFWRRDAHHCLHYRSFGTLSPCYGSAEMKLRWRLLVFEEEIYTTGALALSVHFHPIRDQIWSYNEEYLFLKKRSLPLSPLQELWYTFTLLRISWNEVTMKTTCISRRDIHLRSFGTLSPHYGSAEMKLPWTLIFFE